MDQNPGGKMGPNSGEKPHRKSARNLTKVPGSEGCFLEPRMTRKNIMSLPHSAPLFSRHSISFFRLRGGQKNS
jgi:hypothetical protein